MAFEQSETLLISNRYIVRLAENGRDIKKAQALRYRVFNVELGEGLSSSEDMQLDADKYDNQCDHLLVINREDDAIIGTYRMQTYRMASENEGLYTSDEFDLSKIPKNKLKLSVEVGRACIEQEHRNGRVLYLLWRGLAKYLKLKGSRYLFGCCSITSQDPREAWIVMDYLKQNNYLHDKFLIDTKEKYDCEYVERDSKAWKSISLPQLFRLYMSLGAKVLSKPALDKDFKTIDYLVMLDIEKLDERSRMLFFQ